MTPLWKHRSRNFLSGVGDLIFPAQCSACHIEIADPMRVGGTRVCLCPDCFNSLVPLYPSRCRSCGAGQPRVEPGSFEPGGFESSDMVSGAFDSTSMPEAGIDNPWTGPWVEKCIYCRRSDFHFEQCLAFGNYELGLRDLVLKIKSGGEDGLIHDMARVMAEWYSVFAKPELVIPIPIHWRKRWVRRSIVPEQLAARLSLQIKVHHFRTALRCTRMAQKQGTLSTRDRQANVRKLFRATSPRLLKGRAVLLVDDVMTSGSTLNEAARICLHSGASGVTAVVIARGVGHSTRRSPSTSAGRPQ